MKAKLKKINSNHNNLRTDTVEGHIDFLPEVNLPFMIKAEPIDPNADIRLVWTTPVKSVQYIDSNTIVFETKNSTYEIELLNSDKSHES